MHEDEQTVELFRAYTVDEVAQRESALATSGGYLRGFFSSGPID